MRLLSIPLLAAVLLAAPPEASAQEAEDADLRGPVGTEAGEGEDEFGAIELVDANTGRVVRQQAAGPVEAGDMVTGSTLRRTSEDEDPFAALGIRAGSFILRPSVTVAAGYTSNASGTSGGNASPTVTVTPELDIRSDWSRHEATLNLRGSYRRFFDGTTEDQPSASAEATGRIDMAGGWSTDLEARYAYDEQAISDPDFPAGADTPPGVHTIKGLVALNRSVGPGLLRLEGSSRRTVYEDATSGGVEVDQGDRTNTLHRARLRVGYEVTGAVTPFVEGEVSRRVYDRAVDNDGLMRSGVGYAYRAGVMFDRDPVLTGEIAVGLAHASFDDAALADLRAITVDGSLVWSPSELTTVTLNTATTLDPSATVGSSGSVAYEGSAEVAYAWRRNVTVDVEGGVTHQRYQGTGQVDTGYRAGVGATWKINRTLQLTGRYEHTWLTSNVAGRGYQSDSITAELRVQR